jgi:peptide-methionine (R)-S-oxide reductase
VAGYSREELKRRLTPEQYDICVNGGTERAFSGAYWDNKENGIYTCIVCGKELFDSLSKYDSGTGWPSFWRPISDDKLTEETDSSWGMLRVEVRCKNCGAHLGHVFDDGPEPTGLRYCINSAALGFQKKEK